MSSNETSLIRVGPKLGVLPSLEWPNDCVFSISQLSCGNALDNIAHLYDAILRLGRSTSGRPNPLAKGAHKASPRVFCGYPLCPSQNTDNTLRLIHPLRVQSISNTGQVQAWRSFHFLAWYNYRTQSRAIYRCCPTITKSVGRVVLLGSLKGLTVDYRSDCQRAYHIYHSRHIMTDMIVAYYATANMTGMTDMIPIVQSKHRPFWWEHCAQLVALVFWRSVLDPYKALLKF